jgi:hypothetical protein
MEKKREKLQKLMMKAFKNEIQHLPPEIQYLLTDDLVTAFQNRMTVFQRTHSKTSLQQK